MDENTKLNRIGKRCRRCNRLTPLEAFTTPRMRECLDCGVKRREASLRTEYATRKPRPPAGARLLDTKEGRADYYRARYRDRMADKPEPRVMPKRKLCRRCQRMKPLDAFGSWRVRICLACDGPTLRDLVTAGVNQ